MPYSVPNNRLVTSLIVEEIMQEREGFIPLKKEGEWKHFIFMAIAKEFEQDDAPGG